MWGKYEEMKDDMENCDLFMRIIKDIYHEHTKIPKKKLNEILKSMTCGLMLRHVLNMALLMK
jgi:hypothetical protein